MINRPTSDIEFKPTVLNPAVLGVTAWKSDTNILSPNAYSLNSPKKLYIVGKIINIKVIIITILLCGLYFWKDNLYLKTSLHTKNPIPPIIIKHIIVNEIIGLAEYMLRELNSPPFEPIMSNPALQNAETEWKIAIHIPSIP